MNENRRFFIEFVAYAPSQFIPALVGVVSVPILTRLFSPEKYGQYALIMASLSFLTTLTGWLPMSVIRFYPAVERKGQLESLYVSALAGLVASLLIISILTGVIFGGVYKPAMMRSFTDLLIAGFVVFVLTATFEMFQQFLRAKLKSKEYTLFSAWRSIASLSIGVGLVIKFGIGVAGLLWGHAISLALVLPFLWKTAIGRVPKITSLSGNLIKEMLQYGLPLVIGNLAAWVLSLSDRYVLEYFRGSQEVGIYSVNYSVAEKTILIIASIFHLVSIPMSVHVWEKERGKTRVFVQTITRYYLLLSLPIAVGMSVLSRPVMEVLAGKAYSEGYKVLPFVIISGLLFGIQQRFQSGLVFCNKTSLIMISIITGGAANISLNLIFVPKYGYMAAAVNTLIGYSLLLALMVFFSRKYWAWDFPYESLLKITAAAMAMGIALYLLNNGTKWSAVMTMLLGSALGFFVYTLALIGLQELQSKEIRSLYEIGAEMLREMRYGFNFKR
ncbi:MAG: flippase [Candidatus Methanomethyliaceae archaeon]